MDCGGKKLDLAPPLTLLLAEWLTGFTWQLRRVLLDHERKAKLLTPLTVTFEMELVFMTPVCYL